MLFSGLQKIYKKVADKCPSHKREFNMDTTSVPEPSPITVNSKTAALIIIDMQNDYCRKDGKAFASEYEVTIEPIKALLGRARTKGVPVIYTQNWLSDPGGLWEQAYKQGWSVVPPHCLEGTRGADIIDELKPLVTDYIIRKSSFNMLLGSYKHDAERLLEKFRRDHSKVDTFVVVGVDMNVCVFLNSDALHSYGYNIVLPKDCIGGGPMFKTINGLWFLAALDGARIANSQLLTLG